MKILHICLANYYADNHSYQENILPIEHKRLGYDVEIIASTETFNDQNILDYTKHGKYLTKEDILVTRLKYTSFLPFYIKTKLRFYQELTKELERSDPDIIFIHDVQFASAFELTRYVKKKRLVKVVKVFADCHADFTNSARNWLSHHVLHRVYYKRCALNLNQIVDKFWGVLPDRVRFLNHVYGIPSEKIDLLNLGIDSKWIELSNQYGIRKGLREKLNIEEDNFLICTGGRIDSHKKNTLELMSALKRCNIKNLTLLIFGTVSRDLQPEFNKLFSSDNRIRFLGFVNPDEVNKIIIASDVGVFLGRHSVIWEQAVGLGLPLILGRANSVDHLNHNNNIVCVPSALDAVNLLNSDDSKNNFSSLKSRALAETRLKFSYRNIAIKSLTV